MTREELTRDREDTLTSLCVIADQMFRLNRIKRSFKVTENADIRDRYEKVTAALDKAFRELDDVDKRLFDLLEVTSN